MVELDVSENRAITDVVLAELVALPQLRRLLVDYTGVTDAGVSQLQAACPDLSISAKRR